MNLVVKSTWTRHLVGAAVLAALAACGGGGGGTANNNTGGSTEQTASVTGVAAKGLLRQAQVRALRASDNAVLATTTTDATGQYTLTGLPPGVAVVIEVSPTANTTMVDEATNAVVPVPTGFVLRAATVADTQGVANVQITPFSEMAYQKAKQAAGSGELTADTIAAANADIRLFVGFDILSERPAFSDDGFAAKNKAALMLAAVSKLASDDALGCSSSSGSTEEQQAAKVKCVVEAMSTRGSSDNTLTSALDQAKTSVAADSLEFENVDDDAIPEISQQPEDLVPVGERSTSIDAAKALIANIRSNGALIGGPGDTLETRLRTVADMLNASANPMGDSSRELYSAMLAAANSLDEGTVFSYAPSVAQAIGCKLYEGTNPAASATWNNEVNDPATAGSIGCRVTYSIEQDAQGNYRAFQHNFRVIRGEKADGNSSFIVRSRLIKQKVVLTEGVYNVADASDFVPLAPATAGDFYVGSVDIGRDVNGYPFAMEIQGDYAGGLRQVLSGASLKNTLTLSLAPSITPIPETNGEATTRLSISGAVAASGGSARTVTAQIHMGSYIESRFNNGVSQSMQAVETMASARDGVLNISALDDAGSGITGSLALTAFGAVDADYVPTQLAFNGAVLDGTGTELFSGSVTAGVESWNGYSRLMPYSVSNSAASPSVRLQGSLAVPSRQPMLLDITVAHSFGDGEHLTLSGTYRQGDVQVMLLATLVDDDESSHVTFSTPAGLRLRLQDGEDFAQLDNTSNEVVLGRLDLKKSKIQYADGSYEQY